MANPLNRWQGKVAVVTGASAGIGKAIVEQLVEHGVIVAGIARRVEILEQQAKKLSSKSGKLYGFKADLLKEQDILNAFKSITDKLGPVHILVNNAGVMVHGNLSDGSTEDWQKILNANILALCIATREAIKSMKANNVKGHIVHINSVLGHTIGDYHGFSVYPASKFAVTGLTSSLTNEFAAAKTKIKVTSVSPGLVATEMTTLNPNLNKEKKEFLSSMPALNPEDVANAVIFTLSTPEHVQIQELTVKALGEPF